MQADDAFRLISEVTLSNDWGVLTKYTFALKRRDGAWQTQARECYDRGNGATCLLFDPDSNCVLLTRQFRLPVMLNGGPDALIETPAGLLDGENPEQRMRKELIEETGYYVEKLDHIFDVFMSPGSVTEFLAFFAGTYRKGDQTSQGGGVIEEGEEIEVLNVPLAKAMQMIDTGEIKDAKTIILLQHLFIQQYLKSAPQGSRTAI